MTKFPAFGNQRWGIMLDSGMIHRIYRTRDEAVAAMRRVNESRRRYLAENSIVVPRRAIGIVHYHRTRSKLSAGAARMGEKGGKARAAKLTPERRREIGKKAAETRWGKR